MSQSRLVQARESVFSSTGRRARRSWVCARAARRAFWCGAERVRVQRRRMRREGGAEGCREGMGQVCGADVSGLVVGLNGLIDGGDYEVLGQFALDAVVQGDDVVAQLAEEGEGAGEVGRRGCRPGHVKIVEHVCGASASTADVGCEFAGRREGSWLVGHVCRREGVDVDVDVVLLQVVEMERARQAEFEVLARGFTSPPAVLCVDFNASTGRCARSREAMYPVGGAAPRKESSSNCDSAEIGQETGPLCLDPRSGMVRRVTTAADIASSNKGTTSIPPITRQRMPISPPTL